MTEPALRVLSLGAGVQSTTVLMLALRGELPSLDAAIFADTGWEPRAVYDHLDRVRGACEEAGLPLYVVSSGNIRDTKREQAFYDAPYFLLSPCDDCGGSGHLRAALVEDGEERDASWRVLRYRDPGPCPRCGGSGRTPGMARRQCTHQLKLLPIRRKVRELMAEREIPVTRPGAVEQWIGISLDEWQRAKDSDARFVVHRHPLLDLRMTRHDCKLYLDRIGWTAPRSACIGCPYHSNAEWRQLRDHAPAEFADAVAFEREIQQSEAGLRGTPFLHAQRVPLDEVDLSTREDAGQLTFDEECAGICGV